MTHKGHLVRIRNAVCIGVLIVLALALPVRRADAQQSETPGQELFDDESADGKDSPAKESAGPRTELAPDEKIEMTAEGSFDLSVQGADVRMVLRQLSRQARKNIIVSKNVEGMANVELYGVTMQEALEAILKSNDLVSAEEGNFIYVYTTQEYADLRRMGYRVFRLFYIRADDAKKLIIDILSTNGKIATTPPPEEGIIEAPADVKDWGGAQDHASDAILVVHDYPENLDKVAKILREIDVRPDQVLIEATILSANLDETNALGIDLQVLAGVDFQTFGVTSDLTGITVPAGGGVQDFNHAQGRVVTPFTNNFPSGSSPMTVGFINNNVGVFLQALEGITDTTVLANPKLLIVNKQRGDVLVGNMDGYITTIISQTVATETVEFLETGTKLRVRPFIGKDGYIRMELHPEISRGTVEQKTEGGPALPSKQTTEVTLNVIVRDGKTIVIAGLFRDQIIIQRNQTPVLGNIPLVGQLFRSTVDTTVREEVIILLTPHIIRHAEDELVSERIRDDIERTRVGVRNGLQWFSRSKMADTYTRWARQDATNGNPGRALWNVNLALSLEPKMIDAIRLKERLTHKASWADQPAFMSTRNIIKRMIMQELGQPFEEVSYPTKPLDAEKLSPEVRKTFGIENQKELPLDWPADNKNDKKTPPVPTEQIEVEPAAMRKEKILSPAPVEKPAKEPVPLEKAAKEPVEEPVGEVIEEVIEEAPKVEPVKEPIKKPVEEPDIEPLLIEVEKPLESPRPASKKALPTTQPAAVKTQTQPTVKTQTQPAAEQGLRKSLVEELQSKSVLKRFRSDKVPASQPASRSVKTDKVVVKAKALPRPAKVVPVEKPAKTPQKKMPVSSPSTPTKTEADKTMVKPAPTTTSADSAAVGWVEPRPLSEVLRSMAKK